MGTPPPRVEVKVKVFPAEAVVIVVRPVGAPTVEVKAGVLPAETVVIVVRVLGLPVSLPGTPHG